LNKNNDEQNLDIDSRLLTERIIFLKDELTEEIANAIVAQMLFLYAKEKDTLSPMPELYFANRQEKLRDEQAISR
jgi:hypothetical protein